MVDSERSRSPGDELPEAVIAPSRRRGLQLVWIIPIVAALAGGFIVVKSILERGPTATIAFTAAQGMEAGKTKIRFKDVDIGDITAIVVSEDDTKVIATAQFAKAAAKYLVKDTRFWVVRPRLGAAGVSGLSTLLSGAYIGLDVGKSHEAQHAFTGLEVPPVVSANVPGREYILRGKQIGSLDVGSPLYFRHIQVGQVVAFELDQDGKGVTLRVFVNAPYDKYVTTGSVFWHASGVDVTLDATGVRVETESLSAILSGGIAFQDGPDATASGPAETDAKFTLAANRVEAMKEPDLVATAFLLYFQESLRGLSPGAPIDFGGITVGEVKSIGLEYDPQAKVLRFPVTIDVYPERLRARYRKGAITAASIPGGPELLDDLVAHGLRAQLRNGNLLTGQLYVAMDFFPNAQAAKVDRSKTTPEIPTTPGGLQELQGMLVKISNKLEQIPVDQLANDARQALQTLNRTLQSTDLLVKRLDGDLAPAVLAVMGDAQRTLGTAQQTLASGSPPLTEVREAMRELARAAEAVRLLADTIERQPESLIRGKKADTP